MLTSENQEINQLLNANLLNELNFMHLNNYRLIEISGDNAENFLQGQFTCDVTQVDDQKSSLGALCNHQGRVLAVFIIFKKINSYYCLLPRDISEEFIRHLSKYAIFSKVVLNDVSDNTFLYGCIGKDANAFLQQHFNFDNDSIFLLPGVVPRYFIWSKEKKANATSDEKAWELANILSGNAVIHKETMGVVTPHMLNLQLLDAVSFNKGCYVGQEIVARTHYLGKSKRHLYFAEVDANILLKSGEIVYANGQEAGVIINSLLINSFVILTVVLQDPIEREFVVKVNDECFTLKNIGSFG